MTFEDILESVKQALEQAPERNFSESVDLAINLKNVDMRAAWENLLRLLFLLKVILPRGRKVLARR